MRTLLILLAAVNVLTSTATAQPGQARDLTYGRLLAQTKLVNAPGFESFMREMYGATKSDQTAFQIGFAIKEIKPHFFADIDTEDLYRQVPVFHDDLASHLGRKMQGIKTPDLRNVLGCKGILVEHGDIPKVCLWGGTHENGRELTGRFEFFPLEHIRLVYQTEEDHILRIPHPLFKKDLDYTIFISRRDDASGQGKSGAKKARANVVKDGDLRILLPASVVNSGSDLEDSSLFRVTVQATNGAGIPADLSMFAQPIFVERLPKRPYKISATVRFHPRNIKSKTTRIKASLPDIKRLYQEKPEFYAGFGRKPGDRAEFHRPLEPTDMIPQSYQLVLKAPDDGRLLPNSIRLKSVPVDLAKNGWVSIKSKRFQDNGKRVEVSVESRSNASGRLYISSDYLPNEGRPLLVSNITNIQPSNQMFKLDNQIPTGTFWFTQTLISEIDFTVSTFDGHTKSWSGKLPDSGQIEIVEGKVILAQTDGNLELKLNAPSSDGF